MGNRKTLFARDLSADGVDGAFFEEIMTLCFFCDGFFSKKRIFLKSALSFLREKKARFWRVGLRFALEKCYPKKCIGRFGVLNINP